MRKPVELYAIAKIAKTSKTKAEFIEATGLKRKLAERLLTEARKKGFVIPDFRGSVDRLKQFRDRPITTSTGFCGLQKHSKAWRGLVIVGGRNGRKYRTKTFQSAESAARARDILAIQKQGVGVRLNFNVIQTNTQGRVRLWPVKHIRLLGTNIDSVIAEKIGRSEPEVRRMRKFLKIAPHTVAKWIWTDEQIALLGTMPDLHLAKRLGCTRLTIYRKRKELKIKNFKD